MIKVNNLSEPVRTSFTLEDVEPLALDLMQADYLMPNIEDENISAYAYTNDRRHEYFLAPQKSTSLFAWEDENSKSLSVPFTLSSPPVRALAFDPDADGDLDLFLELEDGTNYISYNIEANLRTYTDFPYEDGELSEDERGWLQPLMGALDCGLEEVHLKQYLHMLSFSTRLHRDIMVVLGDSEGDQVSQVTGYIGSIEQKANYFARELLDKAYVTENCSVVDNMLEHGARMLINIKSMGEAMLTIDPYIGVIDGGIGIGYDPSTIKDSYIIVDRVIPESPAEEAGLQVGDQVVAINGYAVGLIDESTEQTVKLDLFANDRSVEDAMKVYPDWTVRVMINGKPGSTVTLKVKRDDLLYDINVTRSFNLMPHLFQRELAANDAERYRYLSN